MVKSILTLSNLSAVSGDEDNVRAYFVPKLKGLCDNLEIDTIGNIIAFKKGKDNSKKVMIATHIDEVGFIVSDITDKGFIKFKSVGIIDPRTLVSKMVLIGDKVQGVIGMKAIHLQRKEERESTVKVKDLYIDIGATSKKAAEKKVSLGDRITFLTESKITGDIIKGKALDRGGCLSLISAMEIEPQYDTYYVFTAQRHTEAAVMGRGLRVATHRVDPDYAIVINGINSNDFMDAKLPSARMGDGALIEYMDRTQLGDVEFTKKIEEIAKRHNIKYQRKTSTHGASQAGAVMTSATGCKTAVVSIPLRYANTPVGLMNVNDINSVTNLVCEFLKERDVI